MTGGEKDKKKKMDALINMMQEYISEVKKQFEARGNSSKALSKATKKVVAAIYKHDKKELCQWVNCKIVAVVMSVLDALDVTIRLNKTDGHMKTVLKSYAQDLVDLTRVFVKYRFTRYCVLNGRKELMCVFHDPENLKI